MADRFSFIIVGEGIFEGYVLSFTYDRRGQRWYNVVTGKELTCEETLAKMK